MVQVHIRQHLVDLFSWQSSVPGWKPSLVAFLQERFALLRSHFTEHLVDLFSWQSSVPPVLQERFALLHSHFTERLVKLLVRQRVLPYGYLPVTVFEYALPKGIVVAKQGIEGRICCTKFQSRRTSFVTVSVVSTLDLLTPVSFDS